MMKKEEEHCNLGPQLWLTGTQSEALEAPFYVYFGTQKNSFSLRVHGRHSVFSRGSFSVDFMQIAMEGRCAHLIGD